MRRSLLALLLAMALTGQACAAQGGARSASTSAATESTTSTTTTSTTSQPTSQSPPPTTAAPTALAWSACDNGYQCARLRVPVDYAHRNGPSLSLALVRHQAKPADRIGSLLVNPGGPGGSAIELVENNPFSATLSDRFDIVGFDPRGVGRSTPLDCHRNVEQMYDADPTIDDAADRTRYLSLSRTFVDECARKYGTLLSHLGTRDVARDMDEVRKALGEAKLTYVGYSYGTSIGEQYADLFPRRIRAMVLDGVVDPSVSGLAAAGAQADGFEHALEAFLAACTSGTDCHLTATPATVLDAVIASAEKRPIPAPDADRPATPGVVQLALGQGLYSQTLWPDLAQAIADAAKGDGSGLVDLANGYLQRQANGSYPNLFEIYFAVNCLDSAWPRDPDAILAAGKAVGKRDPRLGEGLVNDYVRCALWPVPPQPLPPLRATGSPPIVVISTTGDPATPYASGVAIAKRLPKGVLITNVGDSHTVFSQGKACVDRPVETYLIDLTPPPTGLRCG